MTDLIHATHAIVTADVAFDLIEDDQLAVDTATVILAVMLGHVPPPGRAAIARKLLDDAIGLLEHIKA